jgi:hypothetical protein
VLATRAEDSGTNGQFGLILCNAISTPVDSMYYIYNAIGCFSSVLLKHFWTVALQTIDSLLHSHPYSLKDHYSKYELQVVYWHQSFLKCQFSNVKYGIILLRKAYYCKSSLK